MRLLPHASTVAPRMAGSALLRSAGGGGQQQQQACERAGPRCRRESRQVSGGAACASQRSATDAGGTPGGRNPLRRPAPEQAEEAEQAHNLISKQADPHGRQAKAIDRHGGGAWVEQWLGHTGGGGRWVAGCGRWQPACSPSTDRRHLGTLPRPSPQAHRWDRRCRSSTRVPRLPSGARCRRRRRPPARRRRPGQPAGRARRRHGGSRL